MKTPRSLILLSASISMLTTCDSRHPFNHWNDRDCLLQGDEFSITVSQENGVQVSGWMEHGSGFTARQRNDYWRVAWKTSSLTDGKANSPSKVDYLGKYEAKSERGQSSPATEVGLDMEMSDYTSKNHLLVWNNGWYLSPRIPFGEAVTFNGKRENDGRHRRVLTPSRQHMLVWETPFLICKTSDLKAALVIKESEAIGKLRKLHDTAFGVHDIALTDDLRYLVVIPHNGNDSQYGHNHHRVWGCDLVEDRFFEMSFGPNDGDTAIASVQSWQGRLYFFVYSEQRDLSLLDEQRQLIARIPSERTRFHNFNANFFWQPEHQAVWIAEGEINLNQPKRRIELRKYNYATNTNTDFTLKAGPLKAP